MHKTKEQLKHDLQHASQLMGIGEEELIDRALELYLTSIRGYFDLASELRAWDALSDEALENMEDNLTTIS